MKKYYIIPTADPINLSVEKVLMTSLEAASAEDANMQTGSDFDTFFGS